MKSLIIVSAREASQCDNQYADENAHIEPEASLHAFKQIMQGLPLDSQ